MHPIGRLRNAILGLFCGIAPLLGAGAAHAADPFEAARRIVADHGCDTCHSTDGTIRVPGVPRIAGQKRDYLYRQFMHFRRDAVTYKGETVAIREHGVMTELAARLSSEDLHRLAEFYATRACTTAPVPPATKPPGVERCETCHGGSRTNPWGDTPWLGAQDETYLKRTIRRLWETRNAPQEPEKRYHRLAEIMFVDSDEPRLDDYAAWFARMPCRDPIISK